MKKLLHLIIYIPLLLLSACDVHEFPAAPEKEAINIRLKYDTSITDWEHKYSGGNVIEVGLGDTYEDMCDYGQMRYIVRAYPTSGVVRASRSHTEELVFAKDISRGYDQELDLLLPGGKYSIMVWSDLTESSSDLPYYEAENFLEIMLQGEHVGSTKYRDAYRGVSDCDLVIDAIKGDPLTIDVDMQRPLAKYEFIATDLKEFIDKEYKLYLEEALARGEEPISRVETGNYKVVFYYDGHMAHIYNMFADKPIDSKKGVLFESKIKTLNENEASLGFDYVFVNGTKSALEVKVGIYNKEGKQIALSNSIKVPLRRNNNTIIKGSFLMQEASGGIRIETGFDGENNIVIE